jgi:hypothetical protein
MGRSSSSGNNPTAAKSDLWGAFSIPFFILSDLMNTSFLALKAFPSLSESVMEGAFMAGGHYYTTKAGARK